jgi:hypothetical protein
MRTERTNFDGDWSEICSFCGEPQEAHKKVVLEHDGVRYEQRIPCKPELELIHKKQRKIVQTANALVTGMDVTKWGISKIPFIGEASLIRKIIKRHWGHKLKKK